MTANLLGIIAHRMSHVGQVKLGYASSAIDRWLVGPATGREDIPVVAMPNEHKSETSREFANRLAILLYQVAYEYPDHASHLRSVGSELQNGAAFNSSSTSVSAKVNILNWLTLPTQTGYIAPVDAPLLASILEGEMARISWKPDSRWTMLWEAAKATPGDIRDGTLKVLDEGVVPITESLGKAMKPLVTVAAVGIGLYAAVQVLPAVGALSSSYAASKRRSSSNHNGEPALA
jgi:hypothetical protein